MKLRILTILTLVCYSCNDNPKTTKTQPEQTNISSLTKKERMAIVSEGKKSPNGQIKAVDNSITEIESFKGKLLVIDFWATWCAPCLQEAPLFKDIAEKYKSANAEFISISIDEDFSDWKNYVLEKSWKGKNYWFGMQENKPLFSLLYSKHTTENKEMILIGIPKYVIISPTGKILSNSDLRPSKPEFEMEIKKYLN
ncbi:TlpA family protein disulfide reductase [Aquimarina sp. 2201CG14-23]|uniref:TlpA family protein disulfide reductase n=1 Tax=Aquimarina mycalae TaxID=3040073 RepID=UPI0024781417|nr:TlpA family protein disulfide reductase [Aquimarina sp. 2201CG14-23]MDH7448185.1 TlpA family protein disulfide reductase [Aquimarina sp. 2201CG14-23]